MTSSPPACPGALPDFEQRAVDIAVRAVGGRACAPMSIRPLSLFAVVVAVASACPAPPPTPLTLPGGLALDQLSPAQKKLLRATLEVDGSAKPITAGNGTPARLINCAATAPAMAMTAPTDKSTPPVAMTTAMPNESSITLEP